MPSNVKVSEQTEQTVLATFDLGSTVYTWSLVAVLTIIVDLIWNTLIMIYNKVIIGKQLYNNYKPSLRHRSELSVYFRFLLKPSQVNWYFYALGCE